jgi:hypothetical protein
VPVNILDAMHPEDWDVFPEELKDILACMANETRLVANKNTSRKRLLVCSRRLKTGSEFIKVLIKDMERVDVLRKES